MLSWRANGLSCAVKGVSPCWKFSNEAVVLHSDLSSRNMALLSICPTVEKAWLLRTGRTASSTFESTVIFACSGLGIHFYSNPTELGSSCTNVMRRHGVCFLDLSLKGSALSETWSDVHSSFLWAVETHQYLPDGSAVARIIHYSADWRIPSWVFSWRHWGWWGQWFN